MRKLNNRKMLLSLGTIASVSAPIAAVVSCGYNEPTREIIENKYLLESKNVLNRIQQQWWAKILTEQTGSTVDADNFWATTAIRESFEFVLRQHVTQDRLFLSKVAGSLMTTNAMANVVSATATVNTPYELVSSWGWLDIRENGNITTPVLNLAGKEFLFKNNESFKNEVIKHAISRNYLTKRINKDDYKAIFMDTTDTFSNVQSKILADDFNLINETIDQHLFAKWDVKLTSGQSAKFIDEAKIATKTAADTELKTGGKVFAEAKYSDKHKKLLDGWLPTSYSTLIGFAGIKSEKGTRGKFALDVSGLRGVTNKNDWTGYLVEGDIKDANIPYFPKDQNLVQLTRLVGLMPIYASNYLTLVGTDFENPAGRGMLADLLSMKASVYSKAEKYYIKKTNPITLEIKDKDLRKIGIEHGFEFIKED